MPTYEWNCESCGKQMEAVLTIREYCDAPPQPVCCAQPMARFFSVAPGLAVHNPLAGDRAYAGLRTLDGVDVSTRSKHRAYMKERGLTTADDYRGEWKRAAEARAQAEAGIDASRKADIDKAIEQIKSR
jgi:putative FmdB family regulatory protein